MPCFGYNVPSGVPVARPMNSSLLSNKEALIAVLDLNQ